MLNLTYEYKLKPTAKQLAIFENWLEQCRRVYNYALAERKDWFKSRSCQVNACSIRSEYIIPADTPRPTYASQCNALTAYRKTSETLQSVQSQVLQQTLKRLEKAFVSMWEQNHGFPRFKKAGNMRSFVFPQMGTNPIQNQTVKLPKIGVVKFHQSRPLPDGATIKQARVVRRTSGWCVMLTLQWNVSIPSILPHGEGLGIDVGLTNFIAISNGLLIKRQRFFIDAQRKLKLLQQRVSRKKLGSNNCKKAQKKVAKLHEYIANSRKDWHWKLAHQICQDAGMIFVEDLNLVGLSKAMLGKHCLDAGWGQFFTILEQACFKHGVFFQKVSAHKTSQICPNCGVETGKKELSERVHSCSSCGYTTDRDVAAAQVVLIRGLAAVGHTVKMLSEGKFVGIPVTKESSSL
ncbi:MAG: transposase [Microcoleus sp. PH2017_10_PVI_O_A]|uniref:RNA-guided endonuclease InsQ/TnpB family protein n=1 Tax=unclassified Microcoleus TaxID=2642155 RepID=UPI001D692A63|nr:MULTISPECIES: transposase [unclassified Microcoleus]TAE82802.1 MAG: transposase [Oscillatoriales cyanobacterium]MCC3406600.1 transposase [Microcoleus sp. PH2017_10_PVI_O_A]MCC3460612.1 transposase [Microcoleus sp. PH2017_11_PCY_U_A]MCC3479159.1 transposase [Microcoleus sp. PH2017_12_PCY_D_A]MCC3526563.1 transposase [Microcoleus sp. PH2017_21_RUC_O_A]